MGNFEVVIRKIHLALTNQIRERNLETYQHDTRQLLGLPPSVEKLSGKITHFALKICHSFHQSKEKSTICEDCHYSKYMGIPCIHKIKEYEAGGNSFESSDFHVQWHSNQLTQVCFKSLTLHFNFSFFSFYW